jgi:hypothetical protein
MGGCPARPAPAARLSGERRKDRLPGQTCSCCAQPPLPGRMPVDGRPGLLLIRSAAPCGPPGRRRADGLQNLLLRCSAGPCGPNGATTDKGLYLNSSPCPHPPQKIFPHPTPTLPPHPQPNTPHPTPTPHWQPHPIPIPSPTPRAILPFPPTSSLTYIPPNLQTTAKGWTDFRTSCCCARPVARQLGRTDSRLAAAAFGRPANWQARRLGRTGSQIFCCCARLAFGSAGPTTRTCGLPDRLAAAAADAFGRPANWPVRPDLEARPSSSSRSGSPSVRARSSEASRSAAAALGLPADRPDRRLGRTDFQTGCCCFWPARDLAATRADVIRGYPQAEDRAEQCHKREDVRQTHGVVLDPAPQGGNLLGSGRPARW